MILTKSITEIMAIRALENAGWKCENGDRSCWKHDLFKQVIIFDGWGYGCPQDPDARKKQNLSYMLDVCLFENRHIFRNEEYRGQYTWDELIDDIHAVALKQRTIDYKGNNNENIGN